MVHADDSTLGRSQTSPSPELYRLVRASFVSRGTTLNAWCERNGVKRQYATLVLTGGRNGQAAKMLRARLIKQAFAER
jgi:hypothetical protein